MEKVLIFKIIVMKKTTLFFLTSAFCFSLASFGQGLVCTTGNPSTVFTEEFDNSTSFTGDFGSGFNWQYDNNSTGSSNTGPTGPFSGSHYVYAETSGSSFGDSIQMTSPAIDLSGAVGQAQLSFWLHAFGANIGELFVGVSTSATGPFTNEFTFGPGQLQTASADTFQQQVVNLNSYVGQTIYIQFLYENGSNMAAFTYEGDLAIDLVEVEACVTCPKPTALTTSNATSSTVDVGWTSAGTTLNSIIEYGPAGFSLGSGTQVTATSNPFTVTGLSPAIIYDFYVRDVCGAGDSSSFSGPVADTTTCLAALSGTYTIDGSMATGGTNFSTFAEAGQALTFCGISGAVTFNVQSGTYTDHLHIFGIPGASATNTVTFNGMGSDTLIWDQMGPQAAVLLDSARFVTLNGLNIVNSAPTSEAWGVLVTNGSDSVTIDNCYIEMDTTSTSSDLSAVLVSDEYDDDLGEGAEVDYLTIQNSTLVGGYYAINIEGNGTGNFSFGNRILNNSITHFSNAGMYLDEMQDIEIIGNTIETMRATADGIYTFDMNDYRVEENVVNVTDYGLYIFDGNDAFTPANRSTVINNMVSSTTDYAIYLNGFEATNVFHNSTLGEPGIAINDQVDADIRNNIFSSTGDFAFESFDPLTATDVIDYNLYNSGNANAFDIGPNAYVDLNAWQTAEPAYNANSVSGDPLFASATDLHASSPLADDAGTSVGVMTDIDGDPRSTTTPDIGADEFTAPSCTQSTNFMVVSVGADSVLVSWNPGAGSNFIVEYDTAGFAPGTGNTVVTVDTFAIITGLTASTSYDFYLTDSCGASGVSPTVGPLTVNTLCNPFSIPFVEGFGPTFPICFITNNTAEVFTTTNCATSQGNSLQLNGVPGVFAESPVIDASAQSSVEVSFLYRRGDGSDCGNTPEAADSASVDYWDGTQWVTLDVFKNTAPTVFTPTSYTITSGLTASFQVRFFMHSGSGAGFDNYNFDSLRVDVGANCVPATNLGVDSIATNSASVFWTSTANTSTSFVEYGPQGFVMGSGTILPSTNDTLTIPALADGTCYDFYVTDSCSGTISTVAGPFTFCTKVVCNVSTTPTVMNDSACAGDTATLSATAGDPNGRPVWFNAAGEPVISGDTAVVSGLTQNFNLDVADFVSGNAQQHIGPEPTISTAGFGNFINGLYISVEDTLSIDSATLRSNAFVSGFVVVREDSSMGRIIQRSEPFALDSAGGTFQIPVGLVLTPGEYYLNISYTSPSAAGMGLFRATGGANFPYVLPGLMSIDSVDFPTQVRYYYVFDMVVSEGCIGQTVPVTAFVDTNVVNAGTGLSDTICDTAAAVDLTNFLSGNFTAGGTWTDLDSSGTLTGNMFDPDNSQMGNTFTFRYVVDGDCNSDTTVVTLFVQDCDVSLPELPLGQISVYPNPANTVFYVENLKGDRMTVELFSLSGQMLLSRELQGGNTEAIRADRMADGVYNLRITTQDGVAVKRLVKE